MVATAFTPLKSESARTELTINSTLIAGKDRGRPNGGVSTEVEIDGMCLKLLKNLFVVEHS